MSGHSKWSTIKRKKGAMDAKRGQIFTRLTREIVMAARDGGGDPEANFTLRLAIDRARAQNMPKDNIERAIKRGTGDSKDGEKFEQIFYEGYGPNGIALMIECVTENRNRTVADLRHVLSKAGGSLGEAGSVAWQFTRSAYFTVATEGNDFDTIFELAVEGGADDVSLDEDMIEIIGPSDCFKTLSDQLSAGGIKPDVVELRMIPNQEMALSVDETLKGMRAIEVIEGYDDVVNVFSNMTISEEAMEALESA
jgi:YebC/PmpR family DNA-binding regulatory protein